MKNLKYILPALAILGGVAFASSALAANYFSSPRASSALATSTLVYITQGNATTTVVYDSYGANGTNQSTNNNGNTFAADEASLVVYFTASSTLSQLNINFEYSDNLIDWYQDVPTNVYGYGTTTLPVSLGQVPQYQWLFSSSTAGLPAVASTTISDTRIIKTKPLIRYERAVFTCKIGGANCAFWAQFIPRKAQ